MVDFVKFTVRDFKEITTNPLLKFKMTVYAGTGELDNYQEATYEGMEFRLYDSGLLYVSGSLHKYYNEGKHNYNDFTFSMLKLVIEDLESKFHFELDECDLHNIELGVNITPVVKTRMVLDGLLVHKMVGFDTSHKGHYKQAKHDQYFVKVYDKAFHYHLKGQENRLMRYELKFRKMYSLKPFGISKLSDLYEGNWIESIKELLLKEWSKILIYDNTIKIERFDSETQIQLLNWKNANYWLSLNNSKRSRELKKYKEFVSQHSELIQDRLYEVIKDKWISLSLL